MLKRIFTTLLVLTFLSACTSSAPVPAPTPTVETTSVQAQGNWWRDAVFYEIFVRSYYDTNHDGIGDFNGVTQKLDYLQSLGITAIWLMPIHPSPSYHGYDVINYYNVNPEYGSMADFKNLVTQAHQRGIRVIIDLVLNHTSSEHPWFKSANSDPNSPYRDYYVWSDEGRGGGGWYPGNQGYYFGLFWSGMPDLNYNNPAVTGAMLKVTDFWLNTIGVDGFRVDAAKHLIEEGDKRENTPATHQWLKGFYTAYKAENPQAYTVGEVFGAGSSVVKSYTGDQLDQIFNFEMSSGFVNSTKGGSNSGINSAVKFALQDMPDFNFATFLTNHDQTRVMTVLNGNVDRAKLASFLLLTSPGTAFIYYGEEIGMQGQKPDEDIRLPMQWSTGLNAGFSPAMPWRAPANDYEVVNVELQTGRTGSLLEHYRSLLALRAAHSSMRTGTVTLLETGNPGVYAALRANENETILILANLTDISITDYALTLKSADMMVSAYEAKVLFGQGQPNGPERTGEAFPKFKPFEQLPPYAMYVIQLNPK